MEDYVILEQFFDEPVKIWGPYTLKEAIVEMANLAEAFATRNDMRDQLNAIDCGEYVEVSANYTWSAVKLIKPSKEK